MSRRKLRVAIEIVSDIGCLGFDLQHHSDEQIAGAVKFLRTSNPQMFDWLCRVLADGDAPADTEQRLRQRFDVEAT